MRAKKWLSITFSILISTYFILYLFIYNIDPYGYFSKENKYIHNLTHVSNTIIVHNKLLVKDDIYLIGSSRQMRINPIEIEEYTKKSVQSLAQLASTLNANIFLAKEVKKINKNFLFSFDAFSLNSSRINLNLSINDRVKIYEKEFNDKRNIYLRLFDMNILQASINNFILKIKNKKLNFNELKENKLNYEIDEKYIDNSFSRVNKMSEKEKNYVLLFKNYKLYNDNKIISLAKIANKNDIFIIYPKHTSYYKAFHKYNNIEKQYFHAVKLLVQNTKAQVYSFYDINSGTKNSYNFDGNGWHFKPKVGSELLKMIYTNKQNNNFNMYKLSTENIDAYLNNISTKVDKEINLNAI